ncbi:MAG: diaminopimelate epimerase, partial [Pyrinomonadaceae bacterium]
MRFSKFHGYGNDYIVVETQDLIGVESVGELVRRMCDRHYGAGADGVAVVGRLESDSEADFSLRIYNADGGEAAMSGNGSRSAVSYLYHAGLWTSDKLRLRTRAGVKAYRLLGRDGRGRFRFAAEIGRPVFASDQIPMTCEGGPVARVVGYLLEVAPGEMVRITALQMCNPNVCVVVDGFESVDWRRLGRLIETHPQFPERTNVEFVRRVADDRVEARVWERGVGETLSSGTGACAA